MGVASAPARGGGLLPLFLLRVPSLALSTHPTLSPTPDRGFILIFGVASAPDRGVFAFLWLPSRPAHLPLSPDGDLI